MEDILERFFNGLNPLVDVALKIWPFFTAAVTLAIFLTSIVSTIRKWRKFAHWRVTLGKVVEVKRVLSTYTTGYSDVAAGGARTKSSIDHTVVVEFAALEDGLQRVFSEEINSSWLRYHEGDEAEVHYDPRDPQSASLACVSQNYSGEIIGLFMSMVFFWMFIGSLVTNGYLDIDTVKWWVMVLCGILGLGLLLFSLISVLMKSAKLDRWQSTIGIILSIETYMVLGEDQSVTKEREYSPIVEFTTVEDGMTYVFAGRAKPLKPKYRAGHEVEVLYDPENPKSALISKFTSIYSPEIWAFLLSLLMMTLSIGLKLG